MTWATKVMPRSRVSTPKMRTGTAWTTSTINPRPRRRSSESAIRPTEETPMPTFDGAHYFLSVLVPIKTIPIKDGQTVTSPVHALRKCLDKVAPAAQTPACCGGQSPFAQSNRTHFARLVIIDDVAYPGRLGRNTLLNAITGENLTLAQSQDHLS